MEAPAAAIAVNSGLDRTAATFVLLLVIPVLLVAAVATWLSLGRPIFFRQVRVGRDGRRFEMLKLRSMRTTRVDERGPDLELPPDTAPGGVEGADRRTRVGAFLRRTDRRAAPADQRSQRRDEPGRPAARATRVTGWAQVNGLRGRTSLAERVERDNHYIENWSLWLDVKILLMTPLAVVRSS